MTSDQMISKIGLRLDHEYPENAFGRTERYSFANDSQLYVVGKLPIHMVREAETVSSAQAVDADGGIDLTALDPLILNGDRGILDVLHSGGYYCAVADDIEWQSAVETSRTYSDTRPIRRVQGTNLYLKPYTYGTTTGIIRYKALPTEITSVVACAFADDVQELIVDYAVSVGLKTALQFDAAAVVKGAVDKEIGKHINSFAPPERVRFDCAQALGRYGSRGDIDTLMRG